MVHAIDIINDLFLEGNCIWFYVFLYRRGLSRYFQGKSQSYTSLSSVRCLEDLAKPENPNHKRLKSCKSYGGLREIHHHHHHHQRNRSFSAKTLSRSVNPKKASRGSCSSVNSITRGAHSNRPPVAPHRSSSTTTFSNQAPLFVWCNWSISSSDLESKRPVSSITCSCIQVDNKFQG